MYNRSVNKLKYLSVAVNALKKLKNQSVASSKGENIGGVCQSHERYFKDFNAQFVCKFV